MCSRAIIQKCNPEPSEDCANITAYQAQYQSKHQSMLEGKKGDYVGPSPTQAGCKMYKSVIYIKKGVFFFLVSYFVETVFFV